MLDGTENPILSELRRKRREQRTGSIGARNSELEAVRDNISQTKRKLAQLKKKRCGVHFACVRARACVCVCVF